MTPSAWSGTRLRRARRSGRLARAGSCRAVRAADACGRQAGLRSGRTARVGHVTGQGLPPGTAGHGARRRHGRGGGERRRGGRTGSRRGEPRPRFDDRCEDQHARDDRDGERPAARRGPADVEPRDARPEIVAGLPVRRRERRGEIGEGRVAGRMPDEAADGLERVHDVVVGPARQAGLAGLEPSELSRPDVRDRDRLGWNGVGAAGVGGVGQWEPRGAERDIARLHQRPKPSRNARSRASFRCLRKPCRRFLSRRPGAPCAVLDAPCAVLDARRTALDARRTTLEATPHAPGSRQRQIDLPRRRRPVVRQAQRADCDDPGRARGHRSHLRALEADVICQSRPRRPVR